MSDARAALKLVVVDDDAQIRRALERVLRSHGHAVRSFASAEGYLAEGCAADCMILDVDLPGMSGLELARRLAAGGDRKPVVFITAHDEIDILAAVQDTRRPLVKKPLDEDRLLQAIGRATVDQG